MFTDLLRRLQEPPARLRAQDIRELAGISKPQIYRWLQGENRPQPDALQRLGAALEQDYPHAGVTTADLMGAAGYGPVVRISEVSVSTEPVANVPVDAELGEWINDALRNGVDVREWNLNDPMEREQFCHPTFNWNEKAGFRITYRAYLAAARERKNREGTTPTANGTPGAQA